MKKNFVFRTIILTALIILGLTNCAQNQPANSPTEAFKQFYDAVQKEDVAAARRAFSKKTLDVLNQYFEKHKAPPDESLRQILKTLKPQWTAAPEFRNEKIEGDKATLEIKNSDGKWVTYLFVKEENGWKLELDWLEKLLNG